MVDERLKKMAQVLVNYCLHLKEKDLFFITGKTISEPLMQEVYSEALKAGANPIILPSFEGPAEMLLKHGNDAQISYVNPVEKLTYENTDALLTIWGGSNTKSLSNVDPAKLKLVSQSRSEISATCTNRIANKSLKWCGTQFPTYASAMDADMSLREYEDFIFEACHLTCEDPVAEWKKISDAQQKYVDYLNTKKVIEVKSKDAHLTLNVEGRKWINCDGKENFPDGEIFVSPIEDSVNGHVRFSFPAIYMSREVEDVEITFKDGKIVEAKAKKGEDFLHEILNTDEGVRYVGEFAIGTNYNIQKFTKNILFDEKLGGTIHIAVGDGFPESGGKNSSAIHWDMLSDMKDGGEIYADGELFYKDGKFLI